MQSAVAAEARPEQVPEAQRAVAEIPIVLSMGQSAVSSNRAPIVTAKARRLSQSVREDRVWELTYTLDDLADLDVS
jgi:hypothetical protein